MMPAAVHRHAELAARSPAEPDAKRTLRYIKPRKEQMRYASFHQRNLPIGCGATDSTCWQLQQRTKLGQSLEPTGLRRTRDPRARALRPLGDGMAHLRRSTSRRRPCGRLIMIASASP
jgi:hypothetical protein